MTIQTLIINYEINRDTFKPLLDELNAIPAGTELLYVVIDCPGGICCYFETLQIVLEKIAENIMVIMIAAERLHSAMFEFFVKCKVSKKIIQETAKAMVHRSVQDIGQGETPDFQKYENMRKKEGERAIEKHLAFLEQCGFSKIELKKIKQGSYVSLNYRRIEMCLKHREYMIDPERISNELYKSLNKIEE